MLKKEISIKITIEIAEKECLLQLYFILNKVYIFFAVFAATLELGQTILFILQSNPKIHLNQYRYSFSFFRSHYGFSFMLLLSIDQPIWQFIFKICVVLDLEIAMGYLLLAWCTYYSCADGKKPVRCSGMEQKITMINEKIS
jgi:hypothetical protein